jgi:hypothetical protein
MTTRCTLDMTQFWQRAAETKRKLLKELERSVTTATRAGRDDAKSGEWKDQSGNLRKSINVTAWAWSGTTFWSEYRTQVPYALWVNNDTKAHWIFPKAGYNASPSSLWAGQTRRGRGKGPHEAVVGRGTALRWKDAGGDVHFARRVYHPGTYGFRFMEFSAKHARAVLMTELDRGFVNLRSIWAT